MQTVMRNEANKSFDKSRKKTAKRNSYNILVIDYLHEKYGLTKTYIRQCLDGTRTTVMAETIKKDYKDSVTRVERALNR